MKKIFGLGALAVSAALLASAPAYAAKSGPYAGVRGGVNFQNDDTQFTDFLSLGGGLFTTATATSVETDTGFNVGLVAGYGFNSWGFLSPRFEAEFGYLSNDADTSDSTTNSTIFGFILAPVTTLNDATNGEINAKYGMASILFDLNTGWALTPFVGAGAGFANVRFDRITPTTGTAFNTVTADGESTVFAWNVTAGVAYEVTRNLTLDVSYRYMRFDSIDTNSTNGSNFNSNDVENHQINVGMRYGF